MYRFGMTLLILGFAACASVIIFALYEWRWLVAGLLLAMFLMVWPGSRTRWRWRNILARRRE